MQENEAQTSRADRARSPRPAQACSETKKHYYDAPKGTEQEHDRNSSDFWLGPVVGFHEIAEYGFVEYRERDFRHGPQYGQLTGENRFSIYINGHSIGQSATSLDQALVIAIAYKRDGCNSQAANFFWRATEPRTSEHMG